MYDVNFTARLSAGLTVSSFGFGDCIHEGRDISVPMLDPDSSLTVNFLQ